MNSTEQNNLYRLSCSGYNQIASDFNRTRQYLLWPPLQKIVSTLPDNIKVLDLGCGSGRLLEHIEQKDWSYIGLDNSPELLAIARNSYPDYRFVLGDILSLEKNQELKASAPFDVIFAIAVWHHLPGRDWQVQAVRDSLNYLQPQGQLFITVQNFWRQKKYRRRLYQNIWQRLSGRHHRSYRDLVFPWKDSAGNILGQRYYHVYTRRELKKISRLAGGRIVSLKSDRYNYYLELAPESF